MKSSQKQRQVRTRDNNVKWEYDIVYEECYFYSRPFSMSLSRLKEKVNKYCKDGWIPEGNVSMVNVKDDTFICQAIIRPVDDK